jgi:Mycoplasma protein of unknown function, DUF285
VGYEQRQGHVVHGTSQYEDEMLGAKNSKLSAYIVSFFQFADASSFNGDLSLWNVTSVRNMEMMCKFEFRKAILFVQWVVNAF